jgi:hypothetical protein
MLRVMNTVLKQLRLGTFILAGTTVGLNGCADDPAYQRGAVSPASVQASSTQSATYGGAVTGEESVAVAQNDIVAVSDDSAAAPQTTEAPVTTPAPTAAPPPATAPPPVASPIPTTYDANADADPAALNDFQDTLAPYGTWTDDSTYGRVWVPSNVVVGADFAPYVTSGHWALTDDTQWLWVSDYSWGWAPFHYGRWVWIGGRGWGWIPGRVYSPAWVVWRTGYYDDYYVGWAPMPPSWYWYGGYAVGLTVIPPAPYVFCSSRYVFAPGIRTHIVPASRVAVIGERTRPYVAAMPSPRGGAASYHTMALTRGPSPENAHIPASAVPAQRASHDSHAMAFAQAHPPSAAAPSYRAPFRGTIPAAASRVQPAPTMIPRPAPAQMAPNYVRPAPQQAPNYVRPSPTLVQPAPNYARPAPNVVRSAPSVARPAPVTPRSFSAPRGRVGR